MNKTIKPEAIITNVPLSFFKDNSKWHTALKTVEQRMIYYQQWYLEQTDSDQPVFYHFISCVPIHEVSDVFIAWGGKVQIKARIVEFLKNQPLELPTYSYPQPRDWMVTGGPIIAPPKEISMPGFRGFRYTSMLF